MQWFGTLSKSAQYKYICLLRRQGVMRVHDQNATRMQNVQYGRTREPGPKTRRKKSRVDKAQRSCGDIHSKKLPAGSEAGGGSRLREKWAHRLLWRDPVYI